MVHLNMKVVKVESKNAKDACTVHYTLICVTDEISVPFSKEPRNMGKPQLKQCQISQNQYDNNSHWFAW